jgi:hypothetical protein
VLHHHALAVLNGVVIVVLCGGITSRFLEAMRCSARLDYSRNRSLMKRSRRNWRILVISCLMRVLFVERVGRVFV